MVLASVNEHGFTSFDFWLFVVIDVLVIVGANLSVLNWFRRNRPTVYYELAGSKPGEIVKSDNRRLTPKGVHFSAEPRSHLPGSKPQPKTWYRKERPQKLESFWRRFLPKLIIVIVTTIVVIIIMALIGILPWQLVNK